MSVLSGRYSITTNILQKSSNAAEKDITQRTNICQGAYILMSMKYHKKKLKTDAHTRYTNIESNQYNPTNKTQSF